MTNRKQGFRKLILIQLAQKIALVFVVVFSGKQLVNRLSIFFEFRFPAIVAGCYEVGIVFQAFVQKNIEFYFAVAKHIGIGGAAFAVFGKHVIDYPFFVIDTEIDNMKRNVEFFGNHFGNHGIVFPSAARGNGSGAVVPVHHEQCHHVMSLLLQQIRGNARINTSRQSYYNTAHSDSFKLKFQFFVMGFA